MRALLLIAALQAIPAAASLPPPPPPTDPELAIARQFPHAEVAPCPEQATRRGVYGVASHLGTHWAMDAETLPPRALVPWRRSGG